MQDKYHPPQNLKPSAESIQSETRLRMRTALSDYLRQLKAADCSTPEGRMFAGRLVDGFNASLAVGNKLVPPEFEEIARLHTGFPYQDEDVRQERIDRLLRLLEEKKQGRRSYFFP